MTHLLDQTYGFDRQYENTNTINIQPPEDMMEKVAEIFRVTLHDVAEMGAGGGWRLRSARGSSDRYFSRRQRSDSQSAPTAEDRIRVVDDLPMLMARAVLSHWTPPLDGYDDQDYVQFVQVVQQQTAAVVKQVGYHPTDDEVEVLRKLAKTVFAMNVKNWRAHALSFMGHPTTRPLAPKVGEDIVYGAPVSTVKELHQRVNRAGALVEPLLKYHLAKLFLDPYATDFMYGRKHVRHFGYIRALEMNAFLHEGAPGQTLGEFLEQASVATTIKNLTLEQHSPLTTVLYPGVLFDPIPVFMNFDAADKIGVRTKDIMLNLTKEQWTELYKNPQKKPDLVRTDAKSNTLKYVEGFLEGFFQASTPLDSFPVMDRSAADMAVFIMLLGGDTKRYEQVVQSLHEQPVGRLKHRRKGREMGADIALDLFLNLISLPRIFDNSEALLVFSILHKHDAFDEFDMLDRMLFVKALESPRMFARDNGTVDSALSLLALAVVEDRLSARLMVKMMVEGIKYPKKVPIIYDEESVELVKRLEEAPPEWVMPLFELRVREQKITVELQPFIDTASTS